MHDFIRVHTNTRFFSRVSLLVSCNEYIGLSSNFKYPSWSDSRINCLQRGKTGSWMSTKFAASTEVHPIGVQSILNIEHCRSYTSLLAQFYHSIVPRALQTSPWLPNLRPFPKQCVERFNQQHRCREQKSSLRVEASQPAFNHQDSLRYGVSLDPSRRSAYVYNPVETSAAQVHDVPLMVMVKRNIALAYV